MITSNNLESYIAKAKWKRNKGRMPEIKPTQWIIAKFNDGSYGYDKHPANYYWGFGTAYPVVEYAIVDLIPDPVNFVWPAFNDASKILPELVIINYDIKSSYPVLGLFETGDCAVVYAQQTDDEPVVWYTNCSETWNVTGAIIGWLPLPEAPVIS